MREEEQKIKDSDELQSDVLDTKILQITKERDEMNQKLEETLKVMATVKEESEKQLEEMKEQLSNYAELVSNL